mgnify:CR=1 FL=1
MSTVATSLSRSRLRVGDVLRVGSLGLRTRRLRTGLSTLGVAIGIAAMVGVLGLSASSQEDLNARIRALGTNLLEVQAGTGFGRGTGVLPDTAVEMVGRIGPVTADTARRLGFRVDLVADEHTVPGLVDALVAHVAGPAPKAPVRRGGRRRART